MGGLTIGRLTIESGDDSGTFKIETNQDSDCDDETYRNYWRMLHEAGHALGLSHSNTEDSIMDGMYRSAKEYSPYPIDIAAIKAMCQSK